MGLAQTNASWDTLFLGFLVLLSEETYRCKNQELQNNLNIIQKLLSEDFV